MRTTLAVLVLLAAAQGSPPPLATELSRVRADAAASVPADQRAPIVARLDRAGAALDAGRSYLALYLLESAYESTAAFAFAGAAGVASRDDFLRKWQDTPVVVARGLPPGTR